jgi:ferredoxin
VAQGDAFLPLDVLSAQTLADCASHARRSSVAARRLLCGRTSFSRYLDLCAKEKEMAFVVCEPCRDCKYTDCVVVCPTECFYQDEIQLYIDPLECIDCDSCVPVCPVEAIYQDSGVPTQWSPYVQLNADRVAQLKDSGGHITEQQEPLLGPRCQGKKP